MKILLPVDGSKHGGAAVEELMKLSWPWATEFLVLSVAHPLPYFRDELMVGFACHIDSVEEENKRANGIVAEPREGCTRAEGIDQGAGTNSEAVNCRGGRDMANRISSCLDPMEMAQRNDFYWDQWRSL